MEVDVFQMRKKPEDPAEKKFIPVRCQNPSCRGKVFTHASEGSTVRFRCRGCKTWQIVKVCIGSETYVP